ncbi:MAG TPA: hypothetical protein VM925_30210, partial [Labilithrix sp.]|nr:hypothetical protein [Labilithrix sp.]
MNLRSTVVLNALGFAALATACTAATEPVATQPQEGQARLASTSSEVSTCEAYVEPQDVYCSSKPLGNPKAECAAFGLVPIGKDDNLSGLTFTAPRNAYVAIVKSGTRGCGPGSSAYRVYVDVQPGDVLSTPVDQGISHVTYCDCAS